MKTAGFKFLKKTTVGWDKLNDVHTCDKVSHALRDELRELCEAACRDNAEPTHEDASMPHTWDQPMITTKSQSNSATFKSDQ